VTDPAEVDVAIVGAGPVGVTLALFLCRAGSRVIVLEKDPTINTSPRAMVYLHPLLGDLHGIGMLEPMLRCAWRDREGFNLHLAATGEVISIPNAALDGIHPHPYNLHLGQGEYCRIAVEQLAQYPGATIAMGAQVHAIDDAPGGVTVHYASGGCARSVKARWVVGADGGHSTVRQLIGASLPGTTWDERFVATNVRYPFRSHGFKSSNMYVDDQIGCVIAQISPDGLWRCTFQESAQLPEGTVAERIPAFFARLLGDAAAADVELVAFRPYRMHQRLASTWRRGRAVLAGDAAHLTNPTGGLGLTTGLYDVILLQEALLAVLTGADEDLLDRYADERARVFREITSPNATNFKRLVYDSHDLQALDRAAQPFRDAAATLEGQRAFLAGLDIVRSPRLTVTQ
jgi:3-(3-hydroxy-phenyl)propionate hydroxylase